MSTEEEAISTAPLTILQVGEPVLRQRAADVSIADIGGERIQQLIARMRDTMRTAPGVGLAAPQIGESLRLAVVEDRHEYLQGADPTWLAEREREPVPFYVLVNPELTILETESIEFFEGCLSVAGFTALVPRARAVRVRFFDGHGIRRMVEARGWHARILQHEIDHLDGTLYVDRMDTWSFMTTGAYARHWKDKTIESVRRDLQNRTS
jgi:peptide deformylase